MDDVILVNELDTSQNLVKNINALFFGEDFVVEFALKIIKASHVAIFHDQKIPISF
jgi:hypothetical protein